MKVLLYEKSIIPAEYRTSYHSHSFWHLDYLMPPSGDACYVNPDLEIKFNAGEAILIPPHIEHYIRYDSSCHLFTVRFELDDGDEPIDFEPQVVVKQEYESLFDNIFRDDQNVSELEIKILGHYISILLLELIRKKSVMNYGFSPDKDLRIIKVISYLEKNPFTQLRLEALAGQAGLSVNHFIRKFKQITGLTPKQYILRLKMEKAVRLLEYSDMTVSQIAEAIHFPDIHSFSKAFKKRFKESPGSYKENMKKFKQKNFIY